MSGKIVIPLVAAAMAVGVISGLGPWKEHKAEQRRKAAVDAEMRRVEDQRRAMREKLSLADSSAGREEMVRRLGYMKPGDKPIDELIEETP